MATGYSAADNLRDLDYTRSHRSPPPVPFSPRAPAARTQREAFSLAVANAGGGSAGDGHRSERQRDHTLLSRVNTTGGSRKKAAGAYRSADSDEAVGHNDGDDNDAAVDSGAAFRGRHRAASTSEGSSGRARKGSINFLKRSLSTSRKASLDQPERTFYVAEASAPPLPKTLFAQVQQEAADRPPQDRKGSMLRKVSGMGGSRKKHEEQERRKKEAAAAAAALPRQQPPHLPSLSPLPGMSPFSEERPDSVAMFSSSNNNTNTDNTTTSTYTAYTTAPAPSHARPTANFSRPSQQAMPSGAPMNSSSSPGYSSGRADSALNSSSPPIQHAKVNGGVHSSGDPRRIRRKKDPTPFNILVVGAKSSGKTSFISFLKHSLALPPGKQPHGHEAELQTSHGSRASSAFTSTYLESEIGGERIGLTLWDSKGLERNVVDLQCREMAAFVESKFEETFAEEQKVMRTPGVKDTHIHCVFLVLDPARLDSTIAASPDFANGRKPAASFDNDVDLQVMRALWGKTTVVPIVGKADTLTTGHMSFLKRAVWDAIKTAKLDPLEALELEDDSEEDSEGQADDVDSGDDSEAPLPKPRSGRAHKRQSSLSAIETAAGDTPYLPMSILSPDPYDLPIKGEKVGRRFPWGFADPYDAAHCDFGRLRDSVFSEWRVELRELSRSRWYENWRTSRLKNLPGTRQRVQGGVTPVASVPRGGRIASQTSRQASLQVDGAEGAMEGTSSSPSLGMARSSPSPAANGSRETGSREVSRASVSGSVRADAPRGSESNTP